MKDGWILFKSSVWTKKLS